MKNFRLLAVTAMIAIGLLLGFQPTAHALVLTLDSSLNGLGTIDATVVDADNDGLVSYNGAVPGFAVNVTTGLSNPILGSATAPQLDLNSINVTSFGGTLVIALWDSGFVSNGTLVNFDLAAGGTISSGQITIQLYGDGTNVEPGGTGNLIVGLGPFTPVAFSGTGSGSFVDADNYSLGLVATIIMPQRVVSSVSFNASANGTPVPIPAAGWLIGAGLLPFIRLRRKTLMA